MSDDERFGKSIEFHVNHDHLKMVMDHTDVDYETALIALTRFYGDPTAAIMLLNSMDTNSDEYRDAESREELIIAAESERKYNVKFVMNQTGVDWDTAFVALARFDGDVVEALILLTSMDTNSNEFFEMIKERHARNPEGPCSADDHTFADLFIKRYAGEDRDKTNHADQ